MALDSHSTKPSSSMVGTSPLGFIARYSGMSVPPKAPPTSARPYARSSSAQHHRTFCTLEEFERP